MASSLEGFLLTALALLLILFDSLQNSNLSKDFFFKVKGGFGMRTFSKQSRFHIKTVQRDLSHCSLD